MSIKKKKTIKTKSQKEEIRAIIPPTPEEMRHFATQFSKDEWQFLCDSKGFMDTIATDLITCQMVADTILKQIKNPTSV